MLETRILNRGSGKTTQAIKMMDDDVELFLIVQFESLKKLYPKEIRDRILTIKSILNGNERGKRINKVVIDEGFLLQEEEMAHLYYYLGYHHIDSISLGSLSGKKENTVSLKKSTF